MPSRRVRIADTSTALAANGSYTSGVNRCEDYKTVRGVVRTDKNSAANGFKVQQSPDGSNWDVSDEVSITANSTYTFEHTLYGKFVRVSLTNGSTAQTVLRLVAYMVI